MTRIEPSRPTPLRGAAPLVLTALLAVLWPSAAAAHVKWFAPFIVGAPPQPVAATLANPWFWTGIGLVLAFFLVTRLVEEAPLGPRALHGLDRLSAPLWGRADDFMRATIAGFFIAVFAVGGVYLTPDLQTPAEWVSWVQLLIAGLIFWRRTQPLAAAGILGLWVLALREYEIFHLLDYLALGIGVAGYLLLEALGGERLRRRRFEVLRWGVAIALMWSSLEKFAFPEWFHPLVEERPFLTFGLPRDVFIPMAGVAEFTLGFGLLWTALVRRLSALALLVIFLAAVYPFGRVDLVGHALIMGTLLLIAADPERQVHFAPWLKRRILAVPAGLAVALAVFVTGYWGTHRTIYGPEGAPGAAIAAQGVDGGLSTHAPDPEHPHDEQGRTVSGPGRAEADQANADQASADQASAAPVLTAP